MNKGRARQRYTDVSRVRNFSGLLAAGALLCSINPAWAAPRIFKSQDGKKIEAEIVEKSDNLVVLRTKDNETHSVELSRLSKEDQDFVSKWENPSASEALASTDLAKVMEARGFVGVPFVNEQNHLFIDFKIKGEPVNFLLDSGAMTSLILPSSAKRLKLDVGASRVRMQGIGGSSAVQGETTASECSFEGSSGIAIRFVVTSLPPMAKKIDGLLGSDFFRERQALLDYDANMIWFRLNRGEK